MCITRARSGIFYQIINIKKYESMDNTEYMEELSKRITEGQSGEVALNTMKKIEIEKLIYN